jgi:UDP-N-acetylglucosamine 2-epimerase (non-hydrolysing)/GDP/UDP-N,N'-diacetylbacillosamine 2-epimerase (hydrolysing)
LRVPTVNIGDRQRGRLAATSVLHCAPERAAIAAAIEQAMQLDCSAVVNPYGDGQTVARIITELRRVPPAAQLLKKRFHFVEVPGG